MNILTLPFPIFCGVWLAFLLAMYGLAAYVRWYTRNPSDSGDPSLDDRLTPYEVAYLGGAEARAVQAAIARLVRSRACVLDPTTGVIRCTGTIAPPNASDAEQMFHDTAGQVTGESTAADLSARLSELLEPIRNRLESLGLLVRNRERRIARMLPIAITSLALALGATRYLVDTAVAFHSLDRSYDSRGEDVLARTVLFAASLGCVFFSRRVYRSRRGDAVLARLRRAHADLEFRAGRRLAELSDSQLLMAVALFGHGVVLGGPLKGLEPIFDAAERATPPEGR